MKIYNCPQIIRTRGAGTSKGQRGGAAFLKGTFNTLNTVIITKLLFNTVQQLNTSTKSQYWVRRINTKNKQIIK